MTRAGRRSSPAAAPKIARRSFALCADGSLRLCCIADTHSRPHETSAERIAALAPDVILHAGDIGDLAVLDRFATIAPLVAVRGNIDAGAQGLPDAAAITLTRAEAPVFGIWLTHIAVYGPTLRADVRRAAERERCDLVVCGHSHVPFLSRPGSVAVFNPGSIGPRRFQLPITLGVIEVGPSGVAMRHVDCETGAPWSPR